MNLSKYLLPFLIFALLIFAIIKKVKLYDAFTEGIKNTINLIISIFPYVASILIMTKLFEISGLSTFFISFTTPFFKLFGIPSEVIPLLLIKPFSGGGSLALLNDIYLKYGADSYLARVASVIFGSSETVFYIAAIYYSKCKIKRFAFPIIISLIATFVSAVFACFICKII